MPEQPSEYGKQVFDNLNLDRFADLVLAPTQLRSEDGLVDCDVVLVVNKIPTADQQGEFQPLLLILDSRNVEYVQPLEAIQEPSSAPPESPPTLATLEDGEPPYGSSEAAGDGPAGS